MAVTAATLARNYRPDRDVVMAAPVSREPPNLCSKGGAEQLALDLDAWWHSRGYTTVKHWAEKATLQTPRDGARQGWVVRSNLISGLPPPA